jgi:multidrug resistance protein
MREKRPEHIGIDFKHLYQAILPAVHHAKHWIQLQRSLSVLCSIFYFPHFYFSSRLRVFPNMSQPSSSASSMTEVEDTYPTDLPSPAADVLQRMQTLHSVKTGRSLRTVRSHLTEENLPFRTLSKNANFEEYTEDSPSGEIPGPTIYNTKTGQSVTYKLVTFTPNDPGNPKNWSKAFKWYCTMVVAFTCFVVAFCSSVITADIIGVMNTFHRSEEVALISVSVFVVGFGVGPMIFAPLSEIFGRRVIYGSTLLVAVLLIIPCAVADDIVTLCVFRALDGIAFSAPMTLVGGTLADLWRAEERGVPMAAFSAAPFCGPAIGPLVGGFLSDAAGWRWLYYIQIILAGLVWVLITFTVPETYAPTILAHRAAKLRKSTGDESHTTELALNERPLRERLYLFLLRPFQLLFTELIVMLISLYMSVLYGLLYMFFVAFPIVYQEGKGWSAGSTGLMFIPIAIGVILSACCSPWINRDYLRRVHRLPAGVRPRPELRLIPMMCSCWLIPIGLFIFAWTSYPRLSYWGPTMGGFPVGFGFIFLYNAANNYLVDTYQHQAASALAAKTCIRSFWGAGVVLFTKQMYDTMGYQWASSLLGFIALACCAIPYSFYFFGARIRKHSKYAYNEDEEEEKEEMDRKNAGKKGEKRV